MFCFGRLEIVLNVPIADERSINSGLFKEVPKRKGGLIMNCHCKFPPFSNLRIEYFDSII